MAAPYITTTETSAVGMTIVDTYVQQYLWQNAILVNTITDRSSQATKGVKQIDIGRRTALAAETKNAGVDFTGTNFTWSADSLVLNLHEGVYTILEDAADIESVIAQDPAIMQSSVEALVTKLEAAIYTQLAATKAAGPDHRIKWKTASTLSLADVLEARRLLNNQNVPLMDRFMAIHPDQEVQALALKNFIDASKYGDPQNMPLINGEIGRIYGFRVVVSNNVTTNTGLFYHRSHVAFARQLNLTWERERALKSGGTEFLMQQKYGVKVLDQGVRGVLINDTGA
jgi:hypothetical protein